MTTQTEITIRPAGEADRAPIWAMLKPVFRAGETYAVDRDISEADALGYWFSGPVFLATDDTPLGTFYIHPNKPGGGAHYCNCGFVTAAGSEGKGVARAMVRQAMQSAADLGYEAMVFNAVVASNIRAIGLWKSEGFEVVGQVPGAFRAPDGAAHDTLVMFQRLPPAAHP